MKKSFFLLCFILLFNLCNGSSNNSLSDETKTMVLNIKSETIDNVYMFLSSRENGGWVNIDSALVSLGKDVIFKTRLDNPKVLFLRLENTDKKISFFAENSDIIILPDFLDPRNSKVIGSNTHDELMLYESIFTELNSIKDSAYIEYKSATKKGNSVEAEKIISLFDELEEKENEMNKNYIAAHTNSFVSPYIIRSKMFYSLSLEELKKMTGSLDASLNSSEYVLFLKEHIKILDKVAIGKKFTDFSLPSTDGSIITFSDIAKGKYILIDFWASWCSPCRQENPNVVNLYNKLHNKGFDIIGVSFDNSEKSWKKAIKDDKLVWHQLSDLQGWNSSVGKIYGVKSIPHTVLINPEGIIIAKNLKGDELYQKLLKLLN